jgi:RelA/SpoT family (p)ppGpp synthetase
LDKFLDQLRKVSTTEEAIETLYSVIEPTQKIKEAVSLASNAHQDQKRKSGIPYIVHPISVAALTAYNGSADEPMVIAALLHDVVEDTHITIEEVEEIFDSEIAHLVDGLTKISDIGEEIKSTQQNEKLISSALTFRKMLISSVHNPKVLFIKLCDRLHNMITLDALKPEKQTRISEETLVVYAPIAHRLGISKIKNLLEDLSFYYLYPDEYQKIDDYLKANKQNLHLKLNRFIEEIREIMNKSGFQWEQFNIEHRVKHHYSIHLKMQRKGVSIEEVLDLLAIRIIVRENTDCYKVLGLLHLNFTPLISRFKDYIALPKDNGYKTIHTTLFHKNSIIEAQIRTDEMHHLAQYGIAAHWKYKGGDKEKDSHINLEWLDSLSDQKSSPEEFYELAKSDLFSEDITVLSPDGDKYTLPRDSVALDFAYEIHSDIGKNASGVLINKLESSLLTILKNGDVVKILTNNAPMLRCSWISTVKTSKAKNGIRSICRHRTKEANELNAYSMLASLFSISHVSARDVVRELDLENVIDRLPSDLVLYKDVISKFAKYLGKAKVRPWEIMKSGYKVPVEKEIEHFKIYSNKSISNVHFDYCCHPKMNDEIVAFYDNDKSSVTIHHKLCSDAYKQMNDTREMLFIQWNNSKVSRYKLIISLQNQKGVLANLLLWLGKLGLNVVSINLGIEESENADYCYIEVESQNSDKKELADKISQKFKLIDISNLDDAYNK